MEEEHREIEAESPRNEMCVSACLCGFLMWVLILGIWEAVGKK